jgi:hypothetical protein
MNRLSPLQARNTGIRVFPYFSGTAAPGQALRFL